MKPIGLIHPKLALPQSLQTEGSIKPLTVIILKAAVKLLEENGNAPPQVQQ